MGVHRLIEGSIPSTTNPPQGEIMNNEVFDMKKKLVFAVVAMAVMFGGKADAKCRIPEIPDGVYSTTTMVTNVDYDADVVTIQTFSGIEYQFEGCEDWYEGDICTVTMYDNGTDEVYDDEILQTRYSGWIDGTWNVQ